MDGRRPRARAAAVVCTVVAAVLAAPLVVRADAPASGMSLEHRAARFPRVESAHAEFSQEREVSLVEEVLHARGSLALRAPDGMRLELVEPERLTLIADGATISALGADGKPLPLPPEVAGLAHFARALNELMFGRKAPEQFREQWTDPDDVTLVPESPAAPFAEITLRFPPDRPLPNEIVLRERNGDRTTIRLTSLDVRFAAGDAPAAGKSTGRDAGATKPAAAADASRR